MTRNELSRIFAHIPTLETERLTLRRLKVSDTDDMYEYSCREDVTRYLLWSPHPGRDYTRRYLSSLQAQYRAGEFYDWGMEFRDDGHMIGTAGFTMFDVDNNRAEIGYVLNPAYWSRGIATEAVRAVISYGFEGLLLNRIEARYITGNDRSRHVMEKCGMTFEGIHRSLLYVKDAYRDIGTCALTYRDYQESGALSCYQIKSANPAERFKNMF